MPVNRAKKGAAQEAAIGTLQSLAVFANATRQELGEIAENTSRKRLARGEQLIHAGDPADALYIVLRGRLIVYAGEKPIAEIGPGEPVGELGFFAGRERSADVIAARAGEVLALTRENYDRLMMTLPHLSQSIMAAMAARLADSTATTAKLQPRPGETTALIAAADGIIPDAFIERLATQAASGGDTDVLHIITEKDVPDGLPEQPEKLAEWLTEQSGTQTGGHAARKLFIGGGDHTSDWNRLIIENADAVFVAAEKALARKGVVPLSELEKHLQHEMLKSNVHLVIWRDRHDRPIRNSANWLEGRSTQLHHHVALDRDEDFARLLRFMNGTARGMVLCGGGAFGTAHLGAIKALREHGLSIDMYGGTSVGAAMAAALAVGKSPDEVMGLCEEIFIRSKAMSRLTVPLHSVIDHKRFDEEMRKHYGEHRVEDLPVNFFSVATSLTTNDMHVIREGELWRSVRASSSIPAVFPPVIEDDGEVLIDGALVDNVPINVMRDLKAGPNIVLNFKKGEQWRIHSDYNNLPGRAGAARRILMKRKGDERFPSVVSVLSRTMVITARRLIEATDMGDDVLLEIPTLPRMGFLEWKRGREQFNTAYEAMSRALSETGQCGDMMDRARQAGAKLSA